MSTLPKIPAQWILTFQQIHSCPYLFISFVFLVSHYFFCFLGHIFSFVFLSLLFFSVCTIFASQLYNYSLIFPVASLSFILQISFSVLFLLSLSLVSLFSSWCVFHVRLLWPLRNACRSGVGSSDTSSSTCGAGAALAQARASYSSGTCSGGSTKASANCRPRACPRDRGRFILNWHQLLQRLESWDLSFQNQCQLQSCRATGSCSMSSCTSSVHSASSSSSVSISSRSRVVPVTNSHTRFGTSARVQVRPRTGASSITSSDTPPLSWSQLWALERGLGPATHLVPTPALYPAPAQETVCSPVEPAQAPAPLRVRGWCGGSSRARLWAWAAATPPSGTLAPALLSLPLPSPLWMVSLCFFFFCSFVFMFSILCGLLYFNFVVYI